MSGVGAWATTIGAVSAAAIAGSVAVSVHRRTAAADREKHRVQQEQWRRDRILARMQKAIELATSDKEPARAVGLAQLKQLLIDGDLDTKDLPMVRATAQAALRDAETLNVEVVQVDRTALEHRLVQPGHDPHSSGGGPGA